jgi:hypothetical protein
MLIRELAVEGAVVKWAKARGILVLKLNLIGNTGWPDRLFLHEGRVVFIEFKRPGEKLRRNQPQRVAELRQRGFTVGVYDDISSAIAFLEATLFPS